MSGTCQTQPAAPPEQQRRPSLLQRLGDKVIASKSHKISSSSSTTAMDSLPHPAIEPDSASTWSDETITSRTGLFGRHRNNSNDNNSSVVGSSGKQRRERISDSGPFKIVVDANGVARCVENNKWPPGVDYKVPNRYTKDQGLDGWYKSHSTPGGTGLANTGPDPDWVPGLSKEEKEKISKTKGGWYVF